MKERFVSMLLPIKGSQAVQHYPEIRLDKQHCARVLHASADITAECLIIRRLDVIGFRARTPHVRQRLLHDVVQTVARAPTALRLAIYQYDIVARGIDEVGTPFRALI